MSSLPHIKVNGVAIKNPTDLDIDSYNLTKSGRVASGLMTMEIIAQKWKLECKYDVLSAADMQNIRNLIDAGIPFFQVEFLYEGSYRTIKAYAGAINRKRFRTSSGWYWKDVGFALIEQ
jgi:hypothetical protein